jgi:hypothetical protein
MNETPAPIPVDAGAYLLQAAEEIAKEQDFTPESKEHMGNWIKENMTAIAVL